MDGDEGEEYDDIKSVIFSPNSQRLAYCAEEKFKSRVVLDENEHKEYDDIEHIIFSPDSKRLAYHALYRGGYSPAAYHVILDYKSVVVVDGKEYKKYNDSSVFGRRGTRDVIFSPNSKRIAYVARRGDKEGKEYDDIKGVAFSPDSRQLAYGAKFGNTWRVVVNGTEFKEYNAIGEIIFSPDSRRLAYCAQRRYEYSSWLVVVNGNEVKAYNEIRIINWCNTHQLHYVVEMGKENTIDRYVYLVQETF